jgi:hypothetical protein
VFLPSQAKQVTARDSNVPWGFMMSQTLHLLLPLITLVSNQTFDVGIIIKHWIFISQDRNQTLCHVFIVVRR